MDTLYPATVPTVNLTPGAASLLRWVCRWHSQTGDVHASTSYLARKQRKSERTVYRWLAELRQAGAVSCDVEQGIMRRIVPLIDAPTQRRAARSSAKPSPAAPPVSGVVSHVVSGVVSGVLSSNTDALTQETSTGSSSGVVASLIREGVTAAAAAQLVADQGEAEVREQLEALPHRKARDRAAVLVQSIRQRWAVPSALEAYRQAQRRQQEQQARSRAVAVVAADRAQRQAEELRRLSGLSAGEREALEARALALWQQEQPAAARLMAGRSGSAAVVQGYMLRLLAGGGAP